jgi:ribosomal protein L37AE/L43A
MPHTIERAKTGRAKCRGCGRNIAAGEQRFGERLPNPFADDAGEMTHWFHVPCAAFMRPEPFLATLLEVVEAIDDRERLEHEAQLGIAHRRLPRATTIGRAASGRAACRACKEPIEKGAWRIALMYYEDGRFAPSGFIHLGCSAGYLETTEILNRLMHFSPALADSDWAEIRKLLNS